MSDRIAAADADLADALTFPMIPNTRSWIVLGRGALARGEIDGAKRAIEKALPWCDSYAAQRRLKSAQRLLEPPVPERE